MYIDLSTKFYPLQSYLPELYLLGAKRKKEKKKKHQGEEEGERRIYFNAPLMLS